MTHRPRSVFLASFAAGLAACAAAPVPAAPPDPDAFPALALAEFPSLRSEEIGFAPRATGSAWAAGDEVVYAVRLQKGDDVVRWLLRMSALVGQETAERLGTGGDAAFLWEKKTWSWTWTIGGEQKELAVEAWLLPVTATVTDEHGRVLTSSLVKLPVDLLSRGVLPAVDCLRGDATKTPIVEEAVLRPLVDATIAMMTLLNVVQDDDALAEHFWQVVEKPSVWSVIGNLGVRASLTMSFEKAVPVPMPSPRLPPAERAFVVPLRIDVNDRPALLVDVVAIDAARPFAICGGLVAATARHPTRSDTKLELQLVGAHCGRK